MADLEKQGLLVKKTPLKNSVGECYRCKTVVEPFLSKQWFVRVGPLAERAMEAVKEGDTRIVPKNWEKTYFEWLENIRDWCISRQIWWGHRIPAWKCRSCGANTVEEYDPDKCGECGSTDIYQETDVLDTWFSSALWPFSTMGWPQETRLLKKFYPTDLLVTGFDILFFWVARMMMMGIHFMKEVPFRDVYIHALVRDEDGKKMSKSKGNVIDPIQVIENYGADAFRFTLAAFAAQGRDVKMSESRVEGYRHFVNKLWNAARFSLIHIEEEREEFDAEHFSDLETWILSRSAATLREVKEGIDNYRFNEAAASVYQFAWHEFCDWYLEACKPALYEKEGIQRRDAVRDVLSKVMKDILIMLHPFMPYVTEEIWHQLPTSTGSIMEASYPYDEAVYNQNRDKNLEKDMEYVFALVSGVRNIRSEMNIQPSVNLRVIAQTDQAGEKALMEKNSSVIVNLARLEKLTVSDMDNAPQSSAAFVVGNTTAYVDLKGVIDFVKEEKRLSKEIDKVTKELVSVSKRLNNESFLEKAPRDVVEKVKEQQKGLEEKNDRLAENLARIKKMM